MAWTLTVDGQVYREGDLTIGEVEKMEAATGRTWRTLHPVNSAAQAKAILSVLISSRTGVTIEAAQAKVDALTTDEFTEMVGSYEVEEDMPSQYEDGHPQSADGTSTPT